MVQNTGIEVLKTAGLISVQILSRIDPKLACLNWPVYPLYILHKQGHAHRSHTLPQLAKTNMLANNMYHRNILNSPYIL